MKTPRELLFQHHKNAEPDLDQIRRDALKSIAAEQSHAHTRIATFSWLALWTSGRRFQFAGLAGAWAVILVLNVTVAQNATNASPTVRISSGPAISLAWREYRRQLSEALEAQPAVAIAKPDQRSFLTPKTLNSISNV